jgi:hypothetical protein
MDSNSGVGEFLEIKNDSNRCREAVKGEAGAEDHGQSVRPPHGGLQEARQDALTLEEVYIAALCVYKYGS